MDDFSNVDIFELEEKVISAIIKKEKPGKKGIGFSLNPHKVANFKRACRYAGKDHNDELDKMLDWWLGKYGIEVQLPVMKIDLEKLQQKIGEMEGILSIDGSMKLKVAGKALNDGITKLTNYRKNGEIYDRDEWTPEDIVDVARKTIKLYEVTVDEVITLLRERINQKMKSSRSTDESKESYRFRFEMAIFELKPTAKPPDVVKMYMDSLAAKDEGSVVKFDKKTPEEFYSGK